MPRTMSAGMLAALQATILRQAILCSIVFDNETVYVWSGNKPLVWNGHTWKGVGSMGSITTIEEGSTIEAKGIILTLSGFDPDLLPEVLGHFRQGLSVLVYYALFDSSLALIPDPILAWAGRTDQPVFDVDGNTVNLTISCENRLVEMNVAVDRRYTPEDQQIDYPGDMGFSFVPSIQEMNIYWGITPSGTNNV